ncbi:50S ribosomal protein L29 [Methylococcales bacterium]|nr:50S ribosomal protein L29 [Methylococcales bacterium]
MKASELRQKNVKELKEVETELLRESFNLQMQKATGQLSKPDKIRKIRRDVARVNTVLSEKGRE